MCKCIHLFFIFYSRFKFCDFENIKVLFSELHIFTKLIFFKFQLQKLNLYHIRQNYFSTKNQNVTTKKCLSPLTVMAKIPIFLDRTFVKIVWADGRDVVIRVGEAAHCVSLSVSTKLEGRINTQICCCIQPLLNPF